MRLSKNFTLSEFLKSNVATRKNISNDPSAEQVYEMQILCQKLIQEIRDCLGPLRINSGFRSKELNKAIGGAYKIIDGKYVASSQHCKGQAADLKFVDSNGRVDNERIWDFVLESGLEFDQMINEFDFAWIHISLKDKKNRKMVLEAYKDNDGDTAYKVADISPSI